MLAQVVKVQLDHLLGVNNIYNSLNSNSIFFNWRGEKYNNHKI